MRRFQSKFKMFSCFFVVVFVIVMCEKVIVVILSVCYALILEITDN